MPRSPAAEPGAAAVLLVRNGVTHDARVLRAARTMAEAGLRPLIIGAATAREPAGPDEVGGVPVLRVSAALPRPGRRGPARAAAPPPAAAAPPPQAGAPVFGPPAPAPRGLRRLARALTGVAWQLRAARAARAARPVLVHANDPNTMWAGLLTARSTGARLVYDAHELWPDRNGRWEHRGLLLAQEWLFVRAADAVITASPGYAAAMARRYRIPAPALVRNVPDTAGQPPPAHRPPAPGAAPHAVYVGGLLPGRGLELAVDAVALLPGATLTIVGPGPDRVVAALRDRAARAGAGDRVRIPGPVAPDAVVGLLAGADVGLCLIEPVCRSYELTLPNKLLEYAVAGIPVVASDLPVQAAYVREHGLGAVVALEPRSVAEGIVAAAAGGLAPDARRPRWAQEQAVLRAAYAVPA